MQSEVFNLTRDNPLLSRATILSPDRSNVDHQSTAIGEWDDEVTSLVRDSISENTRRAYLSDLAHFEGWGGCIPSSDTFIASCLAAHAEVLSVATLVRRLSSISKAHASRCVANPARAELVRATLRGRRRRRGSAQRQAKPRLRDDVLVVLDVMGDSLRDSRDRARLLIGFAGGFRRSELIAIDVDDIEFARQGAIITGRRSKTDQTGKGRKIGIPFGRCRHCPVTALEACIRRSGLRRGAVFRPITVRPPGGFSIVGGSRIPCRQIALGRVRHRGAGLLWT